MLGDNLLMNHTVHQSNLTGVSLVRENSRLVAKLLIATSSTIISGSFKVVLRWPHFSQGSV